MSLIFSYSMCSVVCLTWHICLLMQLRMREPKGATEVQMNNKIIVTCIQEYKLVNEEEEKMRYTFQIKTKEHNY